MSDGRGSGPISVRTTFIGYTSMIAASVLGFLVIRHFGEHLSTVAPAAAQNTDPRLTASHDVLFHVLLALAAVIVVGQTLAQILRYFGQPPVIGEVIGGILLGPSLLGWMAPGAAAFLFPREATPFLGVLGQVGVILYMFVVGLEFDTGHLKGRGHTVLAISHASIVVPFLLAGLTALWIYPLLSPAEVPFTPFALFLGVAMSITAFPVLARILTDRDIHRTPLGVMALTCAATDDATAWCLLALVVGVTKAQVNSAATVIALTLGYIVLMVLVVRPLALRFGGRQLAGEPSQGRLAAMFVAVLLSALTTQWIGVHAIFGAFLLGAIIPHDSVVARSLAARLEPLVTALLLPAFFAYTGLRTELGLLSSAGNWLLCGAIIVVATAGKFGGTLAAARLSGLGWREASSLGILMNTRGLMELIVLNIGLELGVISPTLFAMMVIMAIVTTLATSPILGLLSSGHSSASLRSPALS